MVGIDFPLTVVDRVAGNAMGSQDSTDRIVKQSTTFFPEIELEICELEAFRGIGSVGDAASCTTTYNSADLYRLKNFYPKTLFTNEILKGLSYVECAVLLMRRRQTCIISAAKAETTLVTSF